MQKLKELREKMGFSQEELAEKSGISRVSISNLETGTVSEAKISTLRKLASALNVSLDILLS